MKGKKIIGRIEVALLAIFIIVAITFTFLSQKNYKSKLTKVSIVEATDMCIDHETEYIGTMSMDAGGKYKIAWFMNKYAKELDQREQITQVEVSNIILNYKQDANEKEKVGYKTGDMSTSYIDEVMDVEGGFQVATYFKEIPASWKKDATYLVTVKFTGSRKMFVIPASCVLYDNQNDQRFVYKIIEEPKIWGTEYSLKKVNVNVIESNGEYSAVDNSPGDHIIENANANLYEGMLVKIQ